MRVPSIIAAAGVALHIRSCVSSASDPEQGGIDPSSQFTPYGFQSGDFDFHSNNDGNDDAEVRRSSELLNDDTYAASMAYDAQHNLLFIAGQTYATYFDSIPRDLGPEVKGAMGMSSAPGGRDAGAPHLPTGDCFLGVLRLPRPGSPPAGGAGGRGPELIYARRFGTPRNSEACSSVLALPRVDDALLQTSAQLKLALLGHVNPVPLSSAEANAMGPSTATGPGDDGGRQRRRRLQRQESEEAGSGIRPRPEMREHGEQRPPQRPEERELQSGGNRAGFLHSISANGPVTEEGRAYGFVIDFDLSLTIDEAFSTTAVEETPGDGGVVDASFHYAYGALLGGSVLESSPLVYPVAMAQNRRDPNQIYVVSMHSDDERRVVNPGYAVTAREESVWALHRRPDLTLGGAGGAMDGASGLPAGGVPKYGDNFYVKVQQLSVTPYEELMDVEPTADERAKRTMEEGWGFGFKLNDADDVRPSAVVFVKGRTPDEDLLLLGGTTRRRDEEGEGGRDGELDGFVTKLIPPAPSPVPDRAAGSSADDVEDESVHPTKRIDSTTGRDETVTAICLPPPDASGLTEHAFVVGSAASGRGTDGPSVAYVLKMRLDDMSTVWKERVTSVHPEGMGGDVLGQGCAVTPDGALVYLAGTVDGGSALDAGVGRRGDVRPVGGVSDVFVAAFDVRFGNAEWARQLGTVREDVLARGGGVACDNEGNAIVVGSTRGGLQRPRPGGGGGDRRGLQGQSQQTPAPPARLASDVFVMTLSRADGAYANAPFAGDAWGDAAPRATPETIPAPGGAGPSTMAVPVAVLIALVASFLAVALTFLAIRRRMRAPRRRLGRRYASKERMWEVDGDDDDGSYHSRSLGGRGDSGDGWDDGSASIERTRSPSPPGGGADAGDDDRSAGSRSSAGSYSRKKDSANSDYLSSLRREADATMRRMVRNSQGSGATDNDPRLDGGASIKSLLTHYREVKKDGVMEGDGGAIVAGDRGGKEAGAPADDESVRKKGRGPGGQKRRGKPPPPPPPRRKKKDRAVAPPSTAASASPEPDGLSDFTIV